MFGLFNQGSQVLSCSKNFIGLRKFKILLPSELDRKWFSTRLEKKIFDKINILYVGRFKKEKGYLDLISIFEDMKKKISGYELYLTLVGYNKNLLLRKKNISIIKQVNNDNELRKIIDIPNIENSINKEMKKSFFTFK